MHKSYHASQFQGYSLMALGTYTPSSYTLSGGTPEPWSKPLPDPTAEWRSVPLGRGRVKLSFPTPILALLEQYTGIESPESSL